MSARETFDGLTPPIGTSFFKLTEIPILTNKEWSYFESDALVTWNVSLHKYAVNANPTDPNFQANNGRVYLIMVHRGTFNRAVDWTLHSLTVRPPRDETSVIFLGNYPEPNSGVDQDDGSRKYTISYTNQMQMFRNQGNETFTFEAKYIQDFILSGLRQNSYTTSTYHKVEYVKEASSRVGSTSINWMTVFQCLDPSKEINFNFGYVGFSEHTQIGEEFVDVPIKVGEF
ncbi:hypothetical protein ONZ45_g5053 [Pleurotus djamor]|nr:hypothetical protein ONZ45_g5053 [Pleurotus djamor]